MFNNFAQQINTPNVSGNGHSVILACNKSINYVHGTHPKQPTALSHYPVHFWQGRYTFRNQIVPGGTIWLRKLYLVVPFISAGKKGGDQTFQRGPIFSENIGPPHHFFLKYLVRGD